MNRAILLATLLVSTAAAAEPATLPWQLHAMTTDTIVRADTTAAVFDDANNNMDIAETTALSATYRLTDRWAPTVRLAFAGNNAPGAALDGASVANPMVGITYAHGPHLAAFATTTIPIGTGGDPRSAKTNAAALVARPADAAMFDVDHVIETVGGDLAYARHGITLQAEAMLQQAVRVRGDTGATFSTRAAAGAHAGAALGSHVMLGADVLYQRALAGDDPARLTVAAGVRVHVRVGATTLHPGLAYLRGLGATLRGPMILTSETNAITVDLPVQF